MKKLFLLALVVAGLLAMAVKWNITSSVETPLNLQQETVFEVKNGDSLYGVINRLSKQDILQSKSAAKWYVRFFSKPNLVAGEYEIKPGTSFKDLLKLFEKSDVLQYKVTFIEGWTLKQAINALWKKDKLKRTLKSDKPEDILKLDFLKDYKDKRHAEGLFFPATYSFKKGMSDVDILKMAHKKMQSVLETEWKNRAPNLPYKSAYDALIMASIIEKETGVAGERDEIAGVFVRRLNKGMLLQTDPTVIYGMGERYDGNIRRKDLREATDYNTYVISGLPPTPIALSGKKAVHAAVNPKAGTSLYFVASGDGGHVFSDTLAQHNRAVQAYLKKLRAKRNK